MVTGLCHLWDLWKTYEQKEMKKMVVIDFRKAGKYKSKTWLALEALQEKSKGKVSFWNSATGNEPITVKNTRLFVGGKRVYSRKGWGIGKGSTNYYVKKRGYYSKFSENKGFMEGYLKKLLRPHKIERLKRGD